ncbi:hypothetical protein [Henriciella aquimarina]|uniref:hypothetical protein n=1 Tax=Henriciella aquimarina TaxID=545261 RepID=UPI00117B7F42|nr:hypothetical protein [Henriciella aquimarina]
MKFQLIRLFLVWLSVFVLVTAGLLLLAHFAPGMSLWLRSFVLTVIIVPCIMYFIGPFAARIARQATRPEEQP